jgi:hypothetical protein
MSALSRWDSFGAVSSCDDSVPLHILIQKQNLNTHETAQRRGFSFPIG